MAFDHAQARADLDATPADLAAAAAYIERYPKHPPDALTDTTRKRRAMTKKAFDHGTGWAARLALCTGRLALFTLHMKHLGLDDRDAEPGRILDPATIARIKAAVRRLFKGPCYVKIELGENGRVHVHVIAAIDDGPPGLARPSQIVKPIYDLEGVVSYLAKPAVPYTAEGLAVYLKARRSLRRLPRLSCTFNLPRTAPILKPSAFRVSNSPGPFCDLSKRPPFALFGALALAVLCAAVAPAGAPRPLVPRRYCRDHLPHRLRASQGFSARRDRCMGRAEPMRQLKKGREPP